MATTFTTTINAMYTVQQPDPDYVVNVLWTMTGVDGNYTASTDGSTQLKVDDQNPSYIPYDQLTPEIVIGWVNESLGEQGVAEYQSNINGQIESQKNPPVSPVNTPLPWAAE